MACAFSMMSSRRRIGFQKATGVDLFLKTLFPHRFLDHVDPAAKNVGQAAFQCVQAADVV
jgi:hypothetical protein